MSTTPTPNQIRQALARTAPDLDAHQTAAVRLLLDYNHGRIVEEPTWLEAFVSLADGCAYVRWDRLSMALDGDQLLAQEVRDAVRPYSDTERSVMRVAADLGSDRWLSFRFGQGTRARVLEATEEALLGVPRAQGGVSNYSGGANTGSVIQAGTIHGPVEWL